jgi:hypothetical protein
VPGHFTHIYTARRVAEQLLREELPNWPTFGHTQRECGQVMTDWEKFTAIGAIGPDLFYFLQDYNGPTLGPLSDDIMLAFATYYFFDAASEDNWEPLLVILDQVNSTLAGLLRFLIKLQQIWQDFLNAWNATVGPVVDAIGEIADDLLGGVLSELSVLGQQLMDGLKEVAEEELLTYADIFGFFDTCVQKGFQEPMFLWSDMSHYRKPATFARKLVEEAENLKQAGFEERYEQFLAFALGYITHIGTDTVAHSFVNEQCGGPYRNHPQRHHTIENHIDAWVYSQSGPGSSLQPDPWGKTDDYPDLTMSAMWFAVQLDEADPHGLQRPTGLPDDPDQRKALLDKDGEMPDWMAESIVKAMMSAFGDTDHPQILGGSAYQSMVDGNKVSALVKQITGAGPDRPIQELIDDIAPAPSFTVKPGYPLPWEIKTVYKIMYSFYRLQYNGAWELSKPQAPPFIIFPPSSDITNLLQPPDLSGVDSSNPIEDVCAFLLALVEWSVKELGAALQLAGDLVKMLTSPFTYPIRLGIYDIAMMIWNVISRTHEILAHTGFHIPHAQRTYPGGELRWSNEIDIPMITLGGTVDSAFLQALAAAFDPLGNLDRDESVIGVGHSVSDRNYPFYPVLRYRINDTPELVERWEFRRPWAYPTVSRNAPVDGDPNQDIDITTPTETYNPFRSFGKGPDTAYKPLRPGPYPIGAMPDVFFRTNEKVDASVRAEYEAAQTPWDTDALNEQQIGPDRLGRSPIGDPIPFSIHLISQIATGPEYATQFNLDSDRAFAYLTWDWVRAPKETNTDFKGNTYHVPLVPPEGTAPMVPTPVLDPNGIVDPNPSHQWGNGANPLVHGATPLELVYVDPPPPLQEPQPPQPK